MGRVAATQQIADALEHIDSITLQLADHNMGRARLSRADEKDLKKRLAYHNWEIEVWMLHPSPQRERLALAVFYAGAAVFAVGGLCLLGFLLYEVLQSFVSSFTMMRRPVP